VARRLELFYGKKASIEALKAESSFTVILTIPA
jgi:hypothetical protein